MAKRWKSEEITYLRRYAKVKLTSELAERFKIEPDELTAKLTELGLASKDSVVEIRIEHDPLVKVYTRGTKALYAKKWRDAKTLFERANTLNLTILSELHFNELAHMNEFVVQDPNGYSLMICEKL